MISGTQAVQEQYERYPFPPLAIGSLEDVKPVSADVEFAFQYVYGRPAPERLRILDAGCGTGFSSLKLAQANPQAEIVAVDLSQSSLGIAKQRLQKANLTRHVEFLHADLQNLPDLGLFDYIHCSGVIHHLPEPKLALVHLHRSLKPEGLAYLMVYSARARYEIQTIQNILYSLWRDPTNWQEGLMLCRMFFKGLAQEHPLRHHYEHAIQVATDLLGAEVAHSDAFIVDTWLQRCEHLWTVDQWLDLLSQNNYFPARWLDEQAWDLLPYLPALPDYVAHLSEFEKMRILDQLRPSQNFALYVTSQVCQISAHQLNEDAIPRKFAFVKEHQQGHQKVLDNGRGTQIRLSDWDYLHWQAIDGKRSWKTIWNDLCNLEPQLNPDKLHLFANQLLNYYFLAQK